MSEPETERSMLRRLRTGTAALTRTGRTVAASS